MSREEAMFQSLASSGAVVIAFIGVCHEFVGHIVVPWGPLLLGGTIGWHGLGLLTIASGLMMLGGTLRLIQFPVVPMALAMTALGVALGAFAATVHREFHMFAFAVAAAGATTAFFHRKATAQ